MKARDLEPGKYYLEHMPYNGADMFNIKKVISKTEYSNEIKTEITTVIINNTNGKSVISAYKPTIKSPTDFGLTYEFTDESKRMVLAALLEAHSS